MNRRNGIGNASSQHARAVDPRERPTPRRSRPAAPAIGPDGVGQQQRSRSAQRSQHSPGCPTARSTTICRFARMSRSARRGLDEDERRQQEEHRAAHGRRDARSAASASPRSRAPARRRPRQRNREEDRVVVRRERHARSGGGRRRDRLSQLAVSGGSRVQHAQIRQHDQEASPARRASRSASCSTCSGATASSSAPSTPRAAADRRVTREPRTPVATTVAAPRSAVSSRPATNDARRIDEELALEGAERLRPIASPRRERRQRLPTRTARRSRTTDTGSCAG